MRINGLDTGMTDADLDAVVPGKPDAILFPKAEGGATVTHLDAKLTAREAIAGLPEGSIKILAQTVESAAGLFTAGTYRNSSTRLIGMTWGPEDLSAELGAEANREADGTLTEPYRLARSFCLFGAAAAKVPAIETIHVNFRDPDVLRRDTELARRDGFTGRLAIHPAQVAVINEVFTPSGGADRKGEDGGRRFCRQARRGRGRHRRQDVRPPASCARAGLAGAYRITAIRRLPPLSFVRAAFLRLLDALGLRDIGARRVGVEQFVRLGLVVGDRGHRQVGIAVALRIVLDAQIDPTQPEIKRGPAHQLAAISARYFG